MPNVRIKLRTLRSKLDASQEKFAKMINMPLSTYRKKERGETSLTLEEAYSIARLSNETIDEFFLKR